MLTEGLIISTLVLYIIIGLLCLIFIPLLICSFLVTTKALGYPVALCLVLIGYFLSWVTFIFWIITAAEYHVLWSLSPFAISIILAAFIICGTIIYEKVKYHEIFYPYQGD